jgi:Uma2 family endonuclease
MGIEFVEAHEMAITDWNLTLEQFLDLPEAKPALEYDPPCNGNGATVRQKMSPSVGHSALQLAFCLLLLPLQQRGLRVLPELRTVRGSAKVPDVSVYPLEELAHPTLLRGRYPTTPPRIAVEIRSPDEPLAEQEDKCRFYVDEWGCPLALLVDPESVEPEVVVFRPRVPPTVYREAERIEPLYAGFGLDLTPHALWSAADL